MILDRFRLDGKVALVTGAGRGIGAGIALGFAEAGADVACAARTAASMSAALDSTKYPHRAPVVGLTDWNSAPSWLELSRPLTWLA